MENEKNIVFFFFFFLFCFVFFADFLISQFKGKLKDRNIDRENCILTRQHGALSRAEDVMSALLRISVNILNS